MHQMVPGGDWEEFMLAVTVEGYPFDFGVLEAVLERLETEFRNQDTIVVVVLLIQLRELDVFWDC